MKSGKQIPLWSRPRQNAVSWDRKYWMYPKVPTGDSFPLPRTSRPAHCPQNRFSRLTLYLPLPGGRNRLGGL